MAAASIDVIQGIYGAFARGDGPAAFAAMAADIVWNEAEGFPYADGNPYVGVDAIGAGVFARLGGEWDGFAAIPDSFHDAGDTVFVQGRYKGTYKATGKPIDAQFIHVWTVKDGKAVQFQQYADTLQVTRAMGR